MEPIIERFDPADPAGFEALLALLAAAGQRDVPDFPPPCRYEQRGRLTHQVDHKRVEAHVARVNGTLVGYLELALPMRDNVENAEVELVVHPEHRRRGIGRALHAYALDRMRQLGRKRLVAECVAALPDGPARDGAGGAFAAAMGAESVLVEVRRRQDLTAVDAAGLQALADEARPHARGYRLVSWQGPTPEEFVADAAYLSGRLLSDAPIGDLAWEPEQIDVDRHRAAEGLWAACRLSICSAGAVETETGRLVALTAVVSTASTPWHAWQGVTLVDPAHRGHRLGLLTKIENVLAAKRSLPSLRLVDTWNAEVNDYMIAINEAIGYRPVDMWHAWQQEV